MSQHIAPYASPNPLDAMLSRLERSPFHLPTSLFRTAEILACLQTLDDDMSELSERKPRCLCIAEIWRELAGDIVSALPIRMVENQNIFGLERVDPFEVAKRDFPPSGNPPEFRANLLLVLQSMVMAARQAVGCHQRYTDNYHGVICFQLMHHHLVTTEQCATFHRDVIRLPMPEACVYTGIVYRPDYVPDHLPRGSHDPFDLSDHS